MYLLPESTALIADEVWDRAELRIRLHLRIRRSFGRQLCTARARTERATVKGFETTWIAGAEFQGDAGLLQGSAQRLEVARSEVQPVCAGSSIPRCRRRRDPGS